MPWEMAERSMILQRTGRSAEAQALTGKLSAMGYRDPDFGAI
jgi:hypothetical protein